MHQSLNNKYSMNFFGIFVLSLFSQLQQLYVAPFILAWIFALANILDFQMNPMIALFVGCILLVYQQFQYLYEDRLEGFFEYIINNGSSLLEYVFAKNLAQIITGIIPLMFVNFVYGCSCSQCFLIGFEWSVIVFLITCFACVDKKLLSIQLLLVGLPLLTAPIIFLYDVIKEINLGVVYLFAGCNILLVSISCVVVLTLKNKNYD
jgi:hypothetical protein